MLTMTGMIRFNLDIDKAKARDSGMALSFLLMLLEIWIGNGTFLLLAAATLLIDMIAPVIFIPFAYLWFGFAHIMGTIVSKILLFLVYILFVVPMGLIRRMLGKDSLQLGKWKQNDESVFLSRDHLFSRDDLEKPF